MIPVEKFCPAHGPYDAALTDCPYCAALRPAKSEPEPVPAQAVPPPALPSAEAPLAPAPPFVDLAASTAREEPLLGLLWAAAGAERGRVYPIADGSTAGRSKQCEVCLADAEVSEIHCRFTIEDGAFVVWDFGSKSGTWVNGLRIRAATPLAENDELRLGGSVFLLKTLPERGVER